MTMTRSRNTQEILTRMEEWTQNYITAMEAYSLEQLQRKPSPDEWSLGQMLLHLIQTALYMQLRNIEACREGADNSVVTNRGKTDAGDATFAQGGFPPVRIKVPATPQYTPAQPESKDQIRSGMYAVLVKMNELAPVLSSIPSEYTVEHPRLGGLNAGEWFALTEMHFRHHMFQMERLIPFLKDASANSL